MKDLPSKVLVIFCSPETVGLSDSLVESWQLSLKVKPVNILQLVLILDKICHEEGILSDNGGLTLIAKNSDSNVRKGIRLLELIVDKNGDATFSKVTNALRELSIID